MVGCRSLKAKIGVRIPVPEQIMKILIGTNSENKLRQFKRIFINFGSDIELISLKEIGITDSVEKDQDNLLDNAKKKA